VKPESSGTHQRGAGYLTRTKRLIASDKTRRRSADLVQMVGGGDRRGIAWPVRGHGSLSDRLAVTLTADHTLAVPIVGSQQ